MADILQRQDLNGPSWILPIARSLLQAIAFIHAAGFAVQFRLGVTTRRPNGCYRPRFCSLRRLGRPTTALMSTTAGSSYSSSRTPGNYASPTEKLLRAGPEQTAPAQEPFHLPKTSQLRHQRGLKAQRHPNPV
jgi:hypothetical protein